MTVKFVERKESTEAALEDSNKFDYIYYFTGSGSLSILKRYTGDYSKWGYVNLDNLINLESIGRPGTFKLCFQAKTRHGAMVCAMQAGRTLYGAKTIKEMFDQYVCRNV